MKKKLGLLGVGNMGTSILEGLLKNEKASGEQVFVYDKIADKAKAFAQKWKAGLADSVEDLTRKSEVLILAVKPQDLTAASSEINAAAGPDLLLVSILAGTSRKRIAELLGDELRVVRAMPNLGAAVGESMTAYTGDDASSLEVAEWIFSGCGKTVRIEEKHFDLVTAISGSGPAYFFLMMEQLKKAGVRGGLSAEAAELLAVQTAVGAGLLAQASEDDPADLRRRVTSKGGTTEAALKVLEENGFGKIFLKAIEAARDRGQELSRM